MDGENSIRVASLNAGGGWMMVALLTDLPGFYLIEHHKEWPLVLRAVIALIPLMASLLYVRSTARWVRGMEYRSERERVGIAAQH